MHFKPQSKVIASEFLGLIIALLHYRPNPANSLHNQRVCKLALNLYPIKSTCAIFAFPEILFIMANDLWAQ